MSKPKNIRSASVLSMMTSSKSPEGQFGFFYIFSDIYSTWGMKIGQKMNVKSIVKNLLLCFLVLLVLGWQPVFAQSQPPMEKGNSYH